MTNIEEGNKIIAEFIGKTISGDWVMLNDDFGGRYTTSLLKYHSDWNELMLVVDKIKSLGYRIEITITPPDTSVVIVCGKEKLNILYYSETIKCVWSACVQFIQWLNNQKPIV